MRAQAQARARLSSERSSALMDAVDALADMAQRIQLNGPEPTYASEKLAHALYKAAEALALCGADHGEVVAEASQGFRHGLALVAEDAER